jgi:hypothetical protein
MSADAESITVLRANGRRLAKTIHPDGTIDQYDQVKTVDLTQRPLASLAALERLLRALEHRRDCCILRGAPADRNRVKAVRRLLYTDRETGEAPTIIEAPRRWVALDVDEMPRPDWVEPSDLLACACVAIRKLPDDFQPATFIVQATASHGLKPGIRIRLWAYLSRPVTGTELKYWLRRAPVDRSIFGAAQITYTAAPAFLPGAFDPLPTRIDVIPGHGEVIVPPIDRLKPPPRRQQPPSGQGNMSHLLRTIASAGAGNRNNLLYWAACRVTEDPSIDWMTAAASLEAAAVQAGLSAAEAAATITSAYRRGINV